MNSADSVASVNAVGSVNVKDSVAQLWMLRILWIL
jgi:hypothetical protein